MTRLRRWRWIAITVAAATVASVLLIGVDGWADRGAAQCSTRAGIEPGGQHDSWRTGAFRAAGCRAWRRMHQRTPFSWDSRRSSPRSSH
jgi:hypothetical protein